MPARVEGNFGWERNQRKKSLLKGNKKYKNIEWLEVLKSQGLIGHDMRGFPMHNPLPFSN